MKNTFVTISSAGPNRDPSKGTREQPLWDEHAAFIDQLVAEGFVLMGGPLVDENGAMLIVIGTVSPAGTAPFQCTVFPVNDAVPELAVAAVTLTCDGATSVNSSPALSFWSRLPLLWMATV